MGDRAARGHRLARKQSTTRHRGDARQAHALQERSPPNYPPPLGVEIILDGNWMLYVNRNGGRRVLLAHIIPSLVWGLSLPPMDRVQLPGATPRGLAGIYYMRSLAKASRL